MKVKSFSLLLVALFVSFTSIAQYVEPLSTMFENAINPALLEGDVLARNERGEELLSAVQLDKNYYYVAIKLSGDRVYCGVSLVSGDVPNYQDVLKGLKLIGKIVMPTGEVLETNLYRDSDVVKAEAKAFNGTFYRNVWEWYDTDVEWMYDKVYTFYPNGTGSITIDYGTYGVVAPQGPTSSTKVGKKKYHNFSGGFYYDAEGTGTQMFTWNIEGDILTLKVVSSAVSVKASLCQDQRLKGDDEWSREYHRALIDQFKVDFPTNQDVKSQKEKVKSTIESIQRYEDEICRFFIINDVDIVLLPLSKEDDGTLSYKSDKGIILHKIKPDTYIRNECFEMLDYFEIAKKLQLEHLRDVGYGAHYNRIRSNIIAAFSHMMKVGCVYSIGGEKDLSNCFVIYDEQMDDGLAAFRGITDFRVYNVDPIERKAQMLFVRNWQGVAQFCTAQLFFSEDDLLIADALNAKYVRVSNYMSELNDKILTYHAYLKDNRNDSRLKCYYDAYVKEYESMYQEPDFKTLDEFYKLDERLSAVLDMQMRYCAFLE